jgi:hypothetical protein
VGDPNPAVFRKTGQGVLDLRNLNSAKGNITQVLVLRDGGAKPSRSQSPFRPGNPKDGYLVEIESSQSFGFNGAA